MQRGKQVVHVRTGSLQPVKPVGDLALGHASIALHGHQRRQLAVIGRQLQPCAVGAVRQPLQLVHVCTAGHVIPAEETVDHVQVGTAHHHIAFAQCRNQAGADRIAGIQRPLAGLRLQPGRKRLTRGFRAAAQQQPAGMLRRGLGRQVQSTGDSTGASASLALRGAAARGGVSASGAATATTASISPHRAAPGQSCSC